MNSLENLMKPIMIKSLEIPNRVVMPPMHSSLGENGEVTDALLAYLKRRAKGGAGLIITEITAVHPLGVVGPEELAIYNDRFIPGLAKMVKVVHAEGNKIAVQLHHCGRESMLRLKMGEALGPSAIPSSIYGLTPRPMTIEEIKETITSFGSAAARAREVGFDAVEIHGAHGYLLTQFLSTRSNQRQDEYGGDFKARARFLIEVLQAVRKSVGEDFPISLRISAEESIKGGYTIEDVQSIVPDLVRAGADIIHASLGTHGTPGGIMQAPIEYKAGFNAGLARKIKEITDVPVIAVGRFTDPFIADQYIARGDVDLISFGRQHLADPDFLVKARHGARDEIIECLACNQGCIERLQFDEGYIRCAINPETGRELNYPLGPVLDKGKVWVIGGGPGGLTAAYEAARLGHEVTLFERETQTGGQVNLAAKAPFKEAYGEWIKKLTAKVEKAGVDIRLGTEFTEKMLNDAEVNAVILASGGQEITPEVEGTDLANVYYASQVLAGKVRPGENIAIIGGGLIGMETADYLIQKGCRNVIVMEQQDVSPVTKASSHGYMLHNRLRKAGVHLSLNTTVTRIELDSITVVSAGQEQKLDIDQVILAAGTKPEDKMKNTLEGKGIKLVLIGDAVRTRRIIETVEEGAQAAWSL